MGVTAVVAAVATAAGSTFVSANNAAHQATNAHTAEVEAQATANQQITDANTQQTQNQNNAAAATGAAQARVRAISNPDGDSIMTSPLGGSGVTNGSRGGSTGQAPGSTNLNAPPPSPGAVTAPGKTILGG